LEKTFASRPQKEVIRRDSYRGLQKISVAHGDPTRAAIMDVSARLSETYLASPQAAIDDSLFYREMAKWKEKQVEAEKEHADIERRHTFVAILEGLQGALASTQKDPAAQAAAQNQVVADINATEQAFAQQHANVDLALKSYSAKVLSFKEAQTDNAIDIGSGMARSLGEEVAIALGNAERDDVYRAVLQQFAADKPNLKSVLDHRKPDREKDILSIAVAFEQYQRTVEGNRLSKR
jgi:hypothetical protein